jgi:hypothetical protein
MLDHVFLDAVRVLERALDDSLLQRSRHEDRFTSDLLSGDVVWETSVALPGEGSPPRVLADLTLDWSTWSQSAWRSWVLGEGLPEPPEIGVEVVFRLQRLEAVPDRSGLLSVADRLAGQAPPAVEEFERTGIVGQNELDGRVAAVEITFEGDYRLTEPASGPQPSLFAPDAFEPPAPDAGRQSDRVQSDPRLGGEEPRSQLSAAGPERPGSLGPTVAAGLSALAGWVASALVTLGDMDARFLPPGQE